MESNNASTFHPTQWTLVLRSRGESEDAKVALSELCEAYYVPVVAFLRRDGKGDDWAREHAHAFFESVLAKGVGAPDPELGRFRSYLLGALKHFMSKLSDAAVAAKRGGGAEHVAFVEGTDTSPGLRMPGVCDDTLIFDREWALTLIGRALMALEAEHSGKPSHFAALKPWLAGGAECSQAKIAQTLGISETAVKVTIYRLRVRFRELIRTEVAATVDDPADISAELSHLIAVASASPDG